MHKSEMTDEREQCLFAAEMRMSDGQVCFMHTHACTEIVWYRNCCGWLPQGSRRLRYCDGDLAIYQPWLSHGDECERGGRQLCIGISGGGSGKLPPGIWKPDAQTRHALVRIHAALEPRDSWRQERLDRLCGWLAFELRRQFGDGAKAGAAAPWHVRAARRIFDSRFMEPLSVAEVAEKLSINPDYLRQLFVRWTGEPPLNYLIRKRLDAACDLLRLNQQSTAAIASRVGIRNPYYFSRLFRKRFGTTPSEYRARYAGRTTGVA